MPQTGITPLGYMLAIIRDPDADPARKDKLAIAAAPYCHARLVQPAKRDQQAKAARRAGGQGTEWCGDLEYLESPLKQ